MEVETVIEKVTHENESFRKAKKSVRNVVGYGTTDDKSDCV
jgi:hypothetical protein